MPTLVMFVQPTNNLDFLPPLILILPAHLLELRHLEGRASESLVGRASIQHSTG
nr:hypothetical protein Q903MT_gene6148 [Picea sitchensis]